MRSTSQGGLLGRDDGAPRPHEARGDLHEWCQLASVLSSRLPLTRGPYTGRLGPIIQSLRSTNQAALQ